MQPIGVLIAVLSAASFGTANVLIKKGQQQVTDDNGLLTSLVVNVGILLPLGLSRMGNLTWNRTTNIGMAWFVAAGLLTALAGRGLLFAGMRRIGAIRASSLSQAAPVVTVVIGLTFLGEHLTFPGLVGILVTFAGLMVLVTEQLQRTQDEALLTPLDGGGRRVDGGIGQRTSYGDDEPLFGKHFLPRRHWVLGLGLGILSAAAFGSGQAVRKQGFIYLPDAMIGAAVGATAGLAAYLVHALLSGNGSGLADRVLDRPRPLYLAAGVASSAGQWFFFLALAYAPVAYVAVIVGGQALFTVLFSAILMPGHERLGMRLLVATVAVVGGTVLLGLTG